MQTKSVNDVAERSSKVVLPALAVASIQSYPPVSAARAADRRRRAGPGRPSVVPADSVEVDGSEVRRPVQPWLGDTAGRWKAEARRAAVGRGLRGQRGAEGRHSPGADHRGAHTAESRP